MLLGRQGKHDFAAAMQESTPSLLWGKSPCHWAESASRRLRDDGFVMCSDALGGASLASHCLLQHHRHAVSALYGHQLNGAHSLHASLSKIHSSAIVVGYDLHDRIPEGRPQNYQYTFTMSSGDVRNYE